MGKLRYIALLASLLFVGCVKTDVDSYIEPEASCTIDLRMERVTTAVVGTRSGGNNEMTIHRGYIFVFSPDGTYEGFQRVAYNDVDDNDSQYPKILTTISGYDSAKDKIIAVFNYCESSFLGESHFSSLTKDSVSDLFPMDKAYLALLQKDFVDGTYTYGMPMFVNDFDQTSGSSVHEVYRSVARFELYVRGTDISTGHDHTHAFNPGNVKFAMVNAAENGAVGYASRADVAGVVGGSTFQAGDALNYKHTPTTYNPLVSMSEVEPSENIIYLYEFPYSRKSISGSGLTQGVYDAERLSLIIEHKETAESTPLFYKLQLMDKTTNEYFDIKRNHDYRMVIKNVYSDGYLTADEAYAMPPSNIEYEIYDDKGDLTFSNGQYAISMDQVLNYDEIIIYGPKTSTISFDNIRRILPQEVVGSMTPAEIAQMTNIVDFAIVDDQSGVTVTPVQNDFDGDPHLTDDGRSIKLELSGDGSCTIRLKMRLGNLELGFDNIVIHKVGSELGGDSSFDAHPCQLNLRKTKMVEGSWNSPDSDFGARNSGDSLVVYMGENATPVGYKSLNGYISSNSAANAYPYFEPKTREGYFTYFDLDKDPSMKTPKKTKIVLNQLAPFYVGHFGGKAKSGPHHYQALIVEKIEEIEDTRSGKESKNGGLLSWSDQSSKVFYDPAKIYGTLGGLKKYLNFVEGRDITEYIVENNQMENDLPIAARYCYMKNDINGDGVIDPQKEPIVWYLPAANQLLALWVSKHLIDADVDSKYFGFDFENDSGEDNPWYWSCSETAESEWSMPNFYKVARFSMLEGELNINGNKGVGLWGDMSAHVRCVRSIVYDNK